MKVTILDNYFDTLCHLPCYQKLAAHDVTVCNDHLQETELIKTEYLTTTQGARLAPCEECRLFVC